MASPSLFDVNNISVKLFRNFKEINEKDFLCFYRKIFGKAFSKDTFVWFDRLTNGNIWAIAIENESDKYVGLYGLLPLKFYLSGNGCGGYLCHNVGVELKYAGTGLFQYIGKYILGKVLRKKEIAISFPNRFAIRGHKAIGWKDMGSMLFYEKTKFNNNSKSDVKNVHEVDEFPQSLNKFLLKLRDGDDFSLKKDVSFLNWRISKPDHKYKCYVYNKDNKYFGYMILKFFCDNDNDNIRKGHIIDIQAEDRGVLKTLLKKVENVKKQMDLDLLNMWVFEGSKLLKTVENEGYKRSVDDYDYPLILYLKDNSLVDQFVKLNKKKIIISLVDNDVF